MYNNYGDFMNTYEGFIQFTNNFMIAVIVILIIGLILGLFIYYKSKKLAREIDKIECMKCHKLIDKDSLYCKYCGKKVKYETK